MGYLCFACTPVSSLVLEMANKVVEVTSHTILIQAQIPSESSHSTVNHRTTHFSTLTYYPSDLEVG